MPLIKLLEKIKLKHEANNPATVANINTSESVNILKLILRRLESSPNTVEEKQRVRRTLEARLRDTGYADVLLGRYSFFEYIRKDEVFYANFIFSKLFKQFKNYKDFGKTTGYPLDRTFRNFVGYLYGGNTKGSKYFQNVLNRLQTCKHIEISNKDEFLKDVIERMLYKFEKEEVLYILLRTPETKFKSTPIKKAVADFKNTETYCIVTKASDEIDKLLTEYSNSDMDTETLVCEDLETKIYWAKKANKVINYCKDNFKQQTLSVRERFENPELSEKYEQECMNFAFEHFDTKDIPRTVRRFCTDNVICKNERRYVNTTFFNALRHMYEIMVTGDDFMNYTKYYSPIRSMEEEGYMSVRLKHLETEFSDKRLWDVAENLGLKDDMTSDDIMNRMRIYANSDFNKYVELKSLLAGAM